MQLSDFSGLFGGLTAIAIAVATPLIRMWSNQRKVVRMDCVTGDYPLPSIIKDELRRVEKLTEGELRDAAIAADILRVKRDHLETLIWLSRLRKFARIKITNKSGTNLTGCRLVLENKNTFVAEIDTLGEKKMTNRTTGPLVIDSINPNQEIIIKLWSDSSVAWESNSITLGCEQHVKIAKIMQVDSYQNYYYMFKINKIFVAALRHIFVTLVILFGISLLVKWGYTFYYYLKSP